MALRMMFPNGIVMHGQAKADLPGFYINEGAFEWFSGVDVRREQVERPQAHGDFDAPGFLASRVIPVNGFCVAESEAELQHVGNQIKGLFADGSAGRVVVEWNGASTWATVRLGARTKFVPDRESLVGEFQITLWAADPRLYGATHSVTSAPAVKIHHYGNFPASPALTVTGAAPAGYTVSGPGGRQFVVSRALVAGSPHTIDMATGLLRVAGAIVYGGISRGDTWSVPPGQVVSMSVSSAGVANVAASVVDTFI